MRSPDLNAAVAILCLEYGLLTHTQARHLIENNTLSDSDFVLELLAYAPETKVLAAVADLLDMEFVDLSSTTNVYRPVLDVGDRVDMARLEEKSALPVQGPNDTLAVVMANPKADSDTVEYLKRVFGPTVRILLGVDSQIQGELIKLATPVGPDMDLGDPSRRRQRDQSVIQVVDSPVVSWIDNLLARASAEGASDLHFMYQADGSLLVRMRIDGRLRRVPMPLRGREGEVIGALLTRCNTIDPSDKTRPQDGAFSFTAPGGRTIDTRLGMIPQIYGPLVVVRILDPLNVRRKLDSMGFAPETLAAMRHAAAQAQGLILVVGPTGSGKTTTLYALLNEMDAVTKHIVTAEDPVEYRLPNIGQTPIRADLGAKSLTFARALRSFLRLDPDIILVGEIRDEDTAEVALHASITGHLVLSTVHANSALGVFTRLEELGGESFLVAEALSLAVSQRLIARVHECAQMVPMTPAQKAFAERMNLPPLDFVPKPIGCHACSGTGYKGRQAVMEVLVPNEEVRDLVATHAPTHKIFEVAKAEGWTSILTDAWRHVAEGHSTVEEMLRVLDTGKGDI